MTDVSTPELIRAVEQADSPVHLITAVRNLAAVVDAAGIPTLIAVLGYNNPAAALAAVAGLIQLGELAVQPLMEHLDEYDYGARAYSIRALAAIAAPRALDVLITSATIDFAPSVRRAAAKGLGTLHWHQLGDELRSAAQARAFETLLLVSEDADWSIRYAAVVGLEALATAADLKGQIQKKYEQMSHQETELAVRARIDLAQQLLSHV